MFVVSRALAVAPCSKFIILPVPSKSMTINITYFVHGTTTDNQQGISTGQAPGQLSELGVKQSQELPDQLGDKEFDAIFSSDLKRAIESAQISFGNEYEIIEDERLRECDYGKLNQAPEDKVNYSEHIERPFPEGERLKQVEDRLGSFLEHLKEAYDQQHVGIVAHKAPQLALEVLTEGKSWEQAIKDDWRRKGDWQPGWDYLVE